MIENIHREDFSPIDKARAIIEYKGLLGEGKPWSEVEQKIGIIENEVKELLQELNQKVDYIIEMLREEDLRYPYHQSFVDTFQKQQKS